MTIFALTWKPPLGNWLHPVANCNNRAISVCEKLLTATQNQSVSQLREYDEEKWNEIKESFMFYRLTCFSFGCKSFNSPRTFLNSALPPFTIWFALKSAIEYSPVPQSKSYAGIKINVKYLQVQLRFLWCWKL